MSDLTGFIVAVIFGCIGAYIGYWVAHEWYELKDKGWDKDE
jgi:uncharacterized membrane protein YeaQ/YmgE (transglycosylase-associated protein family)